MEKSLCSALPWCRCNFYQSVKNIPEYNVEIICIVIELRLLAVCFVEVVHTVLCLVKRAHFMFMFAANTTRIMFRNVDLKCIQKLVQFGVLNAKLHHAIRVWAWVCEHWAPCWVVMVRVFKRNGNLSAYSERDRNRVNTEAFAN